MSKQKSLPDLFIELATPDPKTGISRWVSIKEFTGEYERLRLGNGFKWGRRSSSLARKYNIETDKSITPGPSIDRIRLTGFNTSANFSQYIRPDIVAAMRKRKCVMLGVNGASENTVIEVDHKDGRKNDMRISNPLTQQMDDFQPLCKAANDVKRQICKRCQATNKRWSAKNIAGNPYDFYEGDEDYNESLGCVGCYQYDPVEYRKRTTKRICQEVAQDTVENILKKLYPTD